MEAGLEGSLWCGPCYRPSPPPPRYTNGKNRAEGKRGVGLFALFRGSVWQLASSTFTEEEELKTEEIVSGCVEGTYEPLFQGGGGGGGGVVAAADGRRDLSSLFFSSSSFYSSSSSRIHKGGRGGGRGGVAASERGRSDGGRRCC